MAKSTKSTPSKARGGGKTKQRAPAKKSPAPPRPQAAPQRRQASKARTASKKSARKSAPQTESWASSVGSLMTSQVGREILADVLDAAAGVLRRNREITEQVVASGGAALESGRELATAAFRAGTSAADDVASATRGMAESAAGTLAELAGEAVRTMMPDTRSSSRGRKGTARSGGKKKAATE